MKPFYIPTQQINSSDTQNQKHEVAQHGPPPTYLRRAQLRGYEGSCIIEHTLITSGDVAEIQTIECSPQGGTTIIETATICFETH